jgi:outer membrane protein OmpA-like peptidoglycan-associated protein
MKMITDGRGRTRRLLGLLAAGLVLGACALPTGGTARPAPTGGTAVDSGGGTGAEGTGGDRSAPPAAGPTGPPALPVLASAQTTDPVGDGGAGPVDVRIDVNELRVSGPTARLTLTAHNTEQPGTHHQWQISSFFSDGVKQVPPQGGPTNDDAFAADGVHLLDPVAGTRHLPGRTEEQDCACSVHLQHRFVPAGGSTLLTATFAAPPPGTPTVDVVVPHVEPFTAIPVVRDAAPEPTAPAPADGLPVLGTRRTVDVTGSRPTDLQIDLNAVAVDGGDMRVVLTARNLNGPDASSPLPSKWQVADFFHVGEPLRPQAATDTLAGVRVVDPAGATRYLPGRTGIRGCTCSSDLSRVFVPTGEAVVLTAVFAAPPPEVTTVDVHVPNTAVFPAVPVGRTTATPAQGPGLQVVRPPDEPADAQPVQPLTFPTASADGAVLDEGDGDFQLAADVLFAFDSAELTPRAGDELAGVAEALRAAGAREAEVVGHTDDVGETAYNQRLSQARAESVRSALAAELGPGVALRATGRGESAPIASNETDGGRALNRRVEVDAG